MKKHAIILALALAAVFPAHAEFTGDTKYACEALMCLASGSRPSECNPSIQKYFSIVASKPHKTVEARRNFLKLCPTASEDPQMSALADSIANGAGQCDSASLNSNAFAFSPTTGRYVISDQLPGNCAAYINSAYTDIKAPKYVGTPDQGGYWVEADKYETALAEYKSRLQKDQKQHGQQQRQLER